LNDDAGIGHVERRETERQTFLREQRGNPRGRDRKDIEPR